MRRLALAPALFALMTGPVFADDVTETLESAIQAYEEGDIQYALEELAYARQLLQAMRTESLASFLPEAPEGWTREMGDDISAGLAMMGGGTGAEATYIGEGENFTLTIVANSPMVSAMAGLFSNTALLGSAGKLVRVGRQKFLEQDGELSAVVDNRILIQASGAQTETMLPILERIDFEGLEDFGS